MKLVLAIAAGALGYCYYRGLQARSTKASLKEEVTRWESEGGNVPAVATPSPAPAPQSTYPSDSGKVRH
jgi:hypothetical protein